MARERKRLSPSPSAFASDRGAGRIRLFGSGLSHRITHSRRPQLTSSTLSPGTHDPMVRTSLPRGPSTEYDGVPLVNKQRAFSIPLALTLALILWTTGCGVHQGTEPPPPQTAPTGPPPVAVSLGSVSISPQYVALAPGQKAHFTATAPGTLQWSVNG